jgi:hypothetical protein
MFDVQTLVCIHCACIEMKLGTYPEVRNAFGNSRASV